MDRAELLDQEASVSLLRTAEAVALFKRAFEIVDGIAHRDLNDAHSRSLVTSAAQPLASLLRNTNSTEALAIQDHALRHLAEVKGNEGHGVTRRAASRRPRHSCSAWDAWMKRASGSRARVCASKS